MRPSHLLATLLLAAPLLASPRLVAPAHAADLPSFAVALHNQAFEPAEVQVPADQAFELRLQNQDKTAFEFESTELHREKIVPAGRSTTLKLGPLKAGRYEFFDDFNPKARGHIVAR